MFITSVSEFAGFLTHGEHSLEEILAFVVTKTCRPIDATSAFISELNNDGTVSYVDKYGIADSTEQSYPPQYSLNEKYPITDAINERSTVWINTLPDWPVEYELLKDLPYTNGEKSFICFPIEKRGTPISVFGIFCSPVIQPDAEIDAFLKTIGNMLSLYVYRYLDLEPSKRGNRFKHTIETNGISHAKLTERQRIILRMMSEGRTNTGIGEILGYSESTIRQETIKIFATLKCNGRREASQLYLEHLINTPEFK
jgi:hypothetical protein